MAILAATAGVTIFVVIYFTGEVEAPSVDVDEPSTSYRIGVGISDCTGPAAGVNFMGYAQLSQTGTGLHLRQFARAYIINDGSSRIAYVSVDVGMIGYGMREAVLQNLEEIYGNTYTLQNLIISGTHTHGTPGGFMEHFMFDVTILGFVKQTFDGLVDGITQAIIDAHQNTVNARIFLNSGELLEANINRSPLSYLRNPEEERAQYEYDVDKQMFQLKFLSTATSEIIGAITWFPVHPVSMNYTNLLITSDNVGYASVLLERYLNNGALPGQGSIVAGFASTNLGDVSPNIKGPVCIDTGLPCDGLSSSCNGETKLCIASGPGENMVESTKIIAERLYGKAVELLTSNGAREINGPVRIIHQFIDVPTQEVTYRLGNGSSITGHGCSAAMGYSFAAGTTDGPGEFDFLQGTTSSSFIWDFVRDLLAPPYPEDITCHAPKPILLATGRMKDPYEWQPSIVSTQLGIIGDVALAAVPGEFTTMSGRRLKDVIRNAMIENGLPETSTVIIAGLSNHYTDYITTYEEYQLQRYEGASTVYGPHTLGIYLSQYEKLANSVLQNQTLEEGPYPPILEMGKLISLVAGVVFDMPDFDNKYGKVMNEPPLTVTRGTTVSTVFIAGHPRNNLMQGKTFLTVERLVDGEWVVVANDAVWETRFIWARKYLAASQVTIEWDVDDTVELGTYRIRHFGHAKSLFGGIQPYEGSTRNFQVI